MKTVSTRGRADAGASVSLREAVIASACLIVSGGCLWSQAPPVTDPEREASTIYREFVDAVSNRAISTPPPTEVVHASLALLLDTLGPRFADLKPVAPSPSREEALRTFEMTIRTLASRPGQRFDPVALAEHAMRLYLPTVDPYSKYSDPKEAERFQDALNAPKAGIGMEVIEQAGKFACFPFPDSAAELAGIPINGKLVMVDGVPVEHKSLFEVANLIRGPAGTSVSLRVEHGFGRSKIHQVLRETVKSPAIVVEKQFGDRLLIRIRKISPAALDELRALAKSMAAEDLSTMTVDLRSCQGGSLEGAVGMAGLFLPKDSFLGSAKGPEIDLKFTSAGDEHLDPRNLVILHNEGTASAAEFLIGALMSHRADIRANMQGEKTYGKAVAQERIPLSNGGQLELVVARLYLPSGQTWEGIGLTKESF